MLEGKFHKMPQIQEENQFRSIFLSTLTMREIEKIVDLRQGVFYIVIQHQ